MGELVSADLGMCGLFLYGQHRPLGLSTGTLRDHQVNKQISLRSRLRLMVSLTSLSTSQPSRQCGRPLGLWWEAEAYQVFIFLQGTLRLGRMPLQ